MTRRPLADTLADVVSSVTELPIGFPMRVTRVDFDLPLEVEVVGGAHQPMFVADLPRWRWTTDFDLDCGRIRFSVGGDQS